MADEPLSVLDTGQLEQLAGITRRRLDYAVSRNVITPVRGDDGRNRFTIHEVLVARAVFRLREILTAPNGGALSPGLVDHLKELTTLELTSRTVWEQGMAKLEIDLTLTDTESALADFLASNLADQT